MASVVVCPHCFLQLAVPDGIESDARVECPACRDQFELAEAEPRALPEVVRVESPDYLATTSNFLPIHERQRREREAQAARPQEDDPQPPADFSTWQTISHVEPLVGHMQAALGSAGAAADKPAAPAAPESHTDESDSATPATAEESAPQQTSDQPDRESGERPPSKSSAVTLADLQSAATVHGDDPVDAAAPVAPAPADTSRPDAPVPQRKMVGPTFDLPNVPLSNNAGATVDLGAVPPSGSVADTDFELDDVEMDPAQTDLPVDKTVSTATDKTVAFGESSPALASAKTVPDATDWQKLIPNHSEEPETAAASSGDEAAAGSGPAADDEPWGGLSSSGETSADQVAAAKIIPTAGRRRKRSVVRTLVGFFVFSVGGLTAGYYVLLYFWGPRGDVLGVAEYVPAAVLPNSFRATPTDIARAGDSMPSSPVDTPVVPPPSDAAIDSTVADDSPNLPVGYEEPVELPAEPPTDRVDESADTPPIAAESQYGAGRVGHEQSPAESYEAEPARFDEPAAAPLPAEVPRVIGGPSYTADELAAALEEAQAAQPGLVAGDLSDKSVRQTKGRSFAKLCELAEVLTFCDDAATIDSRYRRECETLFRDTLADPHTRDEIAQIVAIWIDSPNRRHGGVFLAGSTSGGEIVGDVYEYQLRADDGAVRAILSSRPLESRTDAASTQLGIVGTIVDRPSETIVGYAGNARQAIWVGRAIPLD